MAPIDFVLIFASLGTGILVGFFVALFLFVLFKKMDVTAVLTDDFSDTHGKLKISLAHLQFLIVIFVVAFTFLILSIEHGALIPLPLSVIALLFISALTFIASKLITLWARYNSIHKGAHNAPSSTGL